MSKSLESQVWKSNLKAELKPLAAVIADMGNDDGVGIYPSVEYLSWLVGVSERSIQRGLKELKAMAVLIPVKNPRGGRKLTVHYQLFAENLPTRPSWKELREQKEKGDNVSPFRSQQKGDMQDTKGDIYDMERVTQVSPDPLVGTVSKIREYKTPRVLRAEGIVKPKRPNQEPLEPKIKCPTNILERYGEIYEMFADAHDRAGLERIAKTWADYRLGQPRDRLRTSEQWYHDFLSWAARQKPTRNGNGANGNGRIQSNVDFSMANVNAAYEKALAEERANEERSN